MNRAVQKKGPDINKMTEAEVQDYEWFASNARNHWWPTSEAIYSVVNTYQLECAELVVAERQLKNRARITTLKANEPQYLYHFFEPEYLVLRKQRKQRKLRRQRKLIEKV